MNIRNFMTEKIFFVFLVLMLLTLSACGQTLKPTNVSNVSCDANVSSCGNVTLNVTVTSNNSVNTTVIVKPADNKTTVTPPKKIATFVEGEKIVLSKNLATDPDVNDKITYSYSAPFNSSGEWQTRVGDAGMYNVTVAASDGKLTTIRSNQIQILPLYKPLVITHFDSITVNEGDSISLSPVVDMKNNATVSLVYSGFMNSREYRTTFTDAGEHMVTLFATDGKVNVSKTITVTVTDVNRAPVISDVADLSVIEGQLVSVSPIVRDPDNDSVKTTYGRPLNASGAWQTKTGDEGTYDITITADDGKKTSTKNVRVVVSSNNKPPVLANVSDITVTEEQTVRFSPVVSDPDGNNVSVTYSGWIATSVYITKIGDAGVHTVLVSASDGRAVTTKSVNVTVVKLNRPPTFSDDDWFS